MMSKKTGFLSFLGAMLLTLPWYNAVSGYVLMFAFFPLFLAEDLISEGYISVFFRSRSVFLLSFMAFFIWNLCTLGWVTKVSITGALFIISANSMSCAFIFWCYSIVKRKAGVVLGGLFFVVFWISFEYYSLHADFAIPWLVLGNGLANCITGIQWYEYTGTLGGSLWIFLGNFSLFIAYRYWKRLDSISFIYVLILWVGLMVVPYFISMHLYHHRENIGKDCKIVLVQPNIDPYTEKFGTLSQDAQLQRILRLADSVKEKCIAYYLAPETAIDNDIWEDALNENYSLFSIRDFIGRHSNSRFLTGAITYHEYTKNEEQKATTRYDSTDNRFYDVFNSAVQMDSSKQTFIYHKSKLVLGVEKVPFPRILHFFDKYLLHLGGSTGSLGQQDEPSVFSAKNDIFRPAPIICYESIYGEYNTKFIQKGANLIFILTNDGWWGSNTGYIQHLRCAQLRAIETRRWVARCANTGISAFINSKGVVVQSTVGWEQTAIVGTIETNDRLTFYVQHGDFIGRIAVAISALIVLILLVMWCVKLKNK